MWFNVWLVGFVIALFFNSHTGVGVPPMAAFIAAVFWPIEAACLFVILAFDAFESWRQSSDNSEESL